MTKLTKRSALRVVPALQPGRKHYSPHPALLSEYLQRILLQNELFGDDTKLEGVALTSGGSPHTVRDAKGHILPIDRIPGLTS